MTSATGNNGSPAIKNNQGFSLVEVLVSVLILSAGSIAVMQALGQASAGLTSAERRREALFISSSKMAEAELALRLGFELEEKNGGTVRLGEQSMVWNLSAVPDESRPRVKTLELSVEWNDGGRTRRHGLSTVLRRAKLPGETDEPLPPAQ